MPSAPRRLGLKVCRAAPRQFRPTMLGPCFVCRATARPSVRMAGLGPKPYKNNGFRSGLLLGPGKRYKNNGFRTGPRQILQNLWFLIGAPTKSYKKTGFRTADLVLAVDMALALALVLDASTLRGCTRQRAAGSRQWAVGSGQ